METEKMTAKEYLSQAYRIDRRIDSKIEQVQSLRELATKATATLSDMPRNPSPNVSRMADFIAKAMDLETEINTDLCRLIDLKREITTVVKCVAATELQTLLELRYLCFQTWEDIAEALHYDVRHVYRLHGAALSEVERIRHRQ